MFTAIFVLQAYTLDNLDVGTARSVHIRAIPAFSTGTPPQNLETAVSNTALVWEGKIGPHARFVVSGLNLFNSSETPAQREPAATFLFGKLVSYAVSEAAARTTGATAALRQLLDNEEDPGFCVAGSEQACQRPTTPAGVCNANFEIAVKVRLDHDAVVDALHPRLSARGNGGALVVPVIYAASATPPANTSTFCSNTPGHGSPSRPQRLVAKGPATKLATAANATGWARLPLTGPTALVAGTYWIGFLSSADLDGFAFAAAPGKPPAPLDTYAPRSFASGPGLGPELSWDRGTSNIAIYASTT